MRYIITTLAGETDYTDEELAHFHNAHNAHIVPFPRYTHKATARKHAAALSVVSRRSWRVARTDGKEAEEIYARIKPVAGPDDDAPDDDDTPEGDEEDEEGEE